MFERFRGRVAELGEPMARSVDSSQSYQTRSAGIQKHKPPSREMDDFWELFKEVSIVRESIRAFAGEVVSDGYYVETDNEELRQDLEEWLNESAIVNADVDNDFRKLIEEAIIQQEVRGTALIEIVKDADGGIYGFKSIPPDTVKQYTLPGQSVLLAPDQDLSGIDEEDIVRTDDGDVAAYVQFDDDLYHYRDKEPIGFARDEIIKFTRDGDVGDPWGNSRLLAVQDRIESLLSKLDNNDKAIESLAWKFWLFKFGSEEQPWPEEKIEQFMNSHTAEEFEPGMKQGVQGNVDIETISGEVADIEDYLGFDIDWIVASMPYPKYGLGGFEENVNQFVSRSQENRIRNQIQDARREFAESFKPVLLQKTEELGYDPEEEDPEIVIGLTPEEEMRKMALQEGADIEIGGEGGETDYSRPAASSEGPNGPEPTRPEMQGTDQQDGPSVWDVEIEGSVEELAATAPTSVAVEEEYEQLQSLGEEALAEVRDLTLETYERELAGSLSDGTVEGHQHPRTYRKPAERAVRAALSKVGVMYRSEAPFAAALDATYASLAAEGVVTTPSRQPTAAARTISDNYYAAVRDVAEEMARDISHTVRAGLERGEEFATVRERVETEFHAGRLRRSAVLVSRMELRNAVETARLREYRAAEEVIGVRPSGDCAAVATPLCRQLTGCDGGEPATAYFEDGPIGEQLQTAVPERLLLKGFDPLPAAPPFHYGCQVSLEPVRADTEAGAEME